MTRIDVLVRVARSDGTIGPQLTRTTDDCDAILAERNAAAGRGVAETSVTLTPPARPVCAIRTVPGQTSGGAFMMTFSAGGQTMGALARALTSIVGVHVVDRTNLSGLFDYQLQFSPTPPLSASTDAGASSPTLDRAPANVFDSLRQLGLELRSTRGRIDVLVIDSVQQPTEN